MSSYSKQAKLEHYNKILANGVEIAKQAPKMALTDPDMVWKGIRISAKIVYRHILYGEAPTR